MIALYPELFPNEIVDGYAMKDIRPSKKQGVPIRRIEINNVAYTIRPSFIMPYMTGMTDKIEKALFLRKFDVPFWGLVYVFGKYSMYWYRIEQSLGRNSLVGTTVRNPEDILIITDLGESFCILPKKPISSDYAANFGDSETCSVFQQGFESFDV